MSNFFQYYRQESDVLPKPIWKEVSSRVLDIVSVAITQVSEHFASFVVPL